MGYLINVVRGNWFKLVQPLEKIKWESSEGTVVDYEPAVGDTLKVELVGAYNHYNMEKVQIGLNPKNNKRNLLTYENNGTLPLGLYDIEISVKLADGKRLHSCQPKRVKIVKTNSEASIPDYVEFGIETFTLQGEPFMYVPNGEGGSGDMSNYYTKDESDARYLQTETDPTVPSWAKQSNKPTYTAQEVGALPANTPIPSEVTEATVSGWGFTKNTGNYNKPSNGIPKTDLSQGVQDSLDLADSALQTQAQADWIENDSTKPSFINHKPTIPSAQIQADWNQSDNTKADYIKNKPTIPAAGDVNVIEEVQVNGVALTPDANKAVNVQVPTNTNQLTNGAGYITSAQVPSNYPLISQSALTVQIAPNTFNVWENPISNDLTITLGAEVSGVMNEYLMQFSIASGATPQVTFPSNLQWTGIDTFQGGKTYQVSIVNGYAIGVEFDTITQSNS